MIQRRGMLVVAFFSTVFLLGVKLSWAGWYQNGETVPDTGWRKSRGDFGAMILLTKKAQEFVAAWGQPTASVPISVAQTVHRGERITAFISFVGCTPEQGGLCNITGDFVILKPDGSVYGEFSQVELWTGKSALPIGQLGLGVRHATVEIEPDDPLGRYLVKAKVHDHNGNITLELEQVFVVTED